MSGFFGNAVVPCDVFRKVSCEKIFWRSRHMREHVMFSWSRCLRGHMIWKEHKWNPVNSERLLLYCNAM